MFVCPFDSDKSAYLKSLSSLKDDFEGLNYDAEGEVGKILFKICIDYEFDNSKAETAQALVSNSLWCHPRNHQYTL